MKLFQVAKFYVRKDYGNEYCLIFFFNEKYSLFQISFDICENDAWVSFPYLQIAMGYGRIFSFLFSVGKLALAFDIAGRNWRDEKYYTQGDETPDELAQGLPKSPPDAL